MARLPRAQFIRTGLVVNALLETAPRFLFFTGKGGVGKTSMACATAVALAGAGKRVLLISTDPASNLDEVLETPLGQSPRGVTGVAGLYALNIDPEEAARGLVLATQVRDEICKRLPRV